MAGCRRFAVLFAKGVAMGAADVVPGVSGGTIAFISGIYDELIDSIKAVDISALKTLFRRGPAACWHQINGNFLLALFAGIFTSVFSLAKLIGHLLHYHPVQVWSFFFGLILASVIYIARQQTYWRILQFVMFIVGVAAALLVAFSPPLAVTITSTTLFLSGMLAICAMILPGISGSFILLLIGIYPVIITAVSELDFPVLGIFALGAVAGLLVFSRILSWLLHRHRATTLSVLTGFLAGSLVVVWPWQQQVAPDPASATVWARDLMSPQTFATLGNEAHVTAAVALMLLGMVAVLSLEYLGNRMSRQAEET